MILHGGTIVQVGNKYPYIIKSMKNKNSLFWIYGQIYLTHWFPMDARKFRFWNWVQFYGWEAGWKTIPKDLHDKFPFKKNRNKLNYE